MTISQKLNHSAAHPFAGKVVSAQAAVQRIRAGDTIATGGFVGVGFAEAIGIALEQRFLAEQRGEACGEKPVCDLTLVFGSSQGDFRERGLNRLAHSGLVSRVIGGHLGAAPKIQRLVRENEIEAYNLPQGVIVQLFRDIAARRPAHLTQVGLGTFVDPRHGGGKLNARTEADLVSLTKIGEQECLLYKTFPIQVAILRGTSADTAGNVTMEKEALTLECLAIAMAVRNSGGTVIVQVERMVADGVLKARDVKIPGVLVDCIVVAAEPSMHMQTFGEAYSPVFCGEERIVTSAIGPMPMSVRKIAARRAALELRPHSVVNLGIGIPEGIAAVAAEEQIADLMTLTAEPGVIGGIPARGLNFGAASNASAIIDQPAQFDFYDGGGLDLAFLGMAQVDPEGNVNVSKFAQRVPGVGGFINISQNAKALFFVGTFTTSGLTVEAEGQGLRIHAEGGIRKFVTSVQHRSFSGAQAQERGQPVRFITERCVFDLTSQGLELIEIAPGIDIERDILAHMSFRPLIRNPLTMEARIFAAGAMGLRSRLIPMKAAC